MAERAAVDASPPILLSRAGLTSLLQLAGPEVVVPLSVAEEVRRRGASDPTRRALEAHPWLTVIDVPVPPLIQAWDLGPGESAVLAWAHAHPGAFAGSTTCRRGAARPPSASPSGGRSDS